MDSRPPGLPGETLQDTLNHSHQHPGPTFSFQVVSGPTGPHPGPGSFTIALVIPSILRDRLLESSSRCKHLRVPCNSLRGKRGERRGRRRGSRRGGGLFPTTLPAESLQVAAFHIPLQGTRLHDGGKATQSTG